MLWKVYVDGNIYKLAPELAQYICYGIILTVNLVLQAGFYLAPLWGS